MRSCGNRLFTFDVRYGEGTKATFRLLPCVLHGNCKTLQHGECMLGCQQNAFLVTDEKFKLVEAKNKQMAKLKDVFKNDIMLAHEGLGMGLSPVEIIRDAHSASDLYRKIYTLLSVNSPVGFLEIGNDIAASALLFCVVLVL